MFHWATSELTKMDPDKRFRCLQCGRSYKLKTHLTRHVRFECGVEPQFHCTHCGKSFTRKDSMTTHIRMFHRQEHNIPVG